MSEREQFEAIVSDTRERLYKADMHYHGSFMASFRDGSGMHSGVFDVAELIAGYIVAERQASRKATAREIVAKLRERADKLEALSKEMSDRDDRIAQITACEALRGQAAEIAREYGLEE